MLNTQNIKLIAGDIYAKKFYSRFGFEKRKDFSFFMKTNKIKLKEHVNVKNLIKHILKQELPNNTCFTHEVLSCNKVLPKDVMNIVLDYYTQDKDYDICDMCEEKISHAKKVKYYKTALWSEGKGIGQPSIGHQRLCGDKCKMEFLEMVVHFNHKYF